MNKSMEQVYEQVYGTSLWNKSMEQVYGTSLWNKSMEQVYDQVYGTGL
jgi:hypothetical protein